jgi:alkyldihydroxyacetonephosphate synthase
VSPVADPIVAGAPPGKWWGWGDPAKRAPPSAAALAMLRAELGDGRPVRPVELDQVAMPAPRALPDAVAATVNPASVLTAHEQRLRRAAGKGYADLLRLRSGRLEQVPDAIVMPGSGEQIAALLDACAREGVAVVPFGGGTSVVGGVNPEPGRHGWVISLDLRRIRAVDVDPVSLVATLGPGLRGPEAEEALRARGYTLGHFPQSFEYATIGGFAATRSAGQASSGYGRFDDLVTALAMVTPAGELRTGATPHTAAGPSLRQLALGSEGVLGVISEVSVRIRPAPARARYEGWMAPDFASGCELIRALAQDDSLPDVIRLSDEAETRVSVALVGAGAARRALLGTYLRLRRRRGGCLVICGWEGDDESVDGRRSRSAALLRRGGAAALGEAPGRAWQRSRFEGPYLRDELMDLGYMVETLETAHSWARLGELYRAVREALQDALAGQGTPPIVMCHLSHAYPDGASLYFTFLARQRPGAELEQWHAAKGAACEAMVAAGATITHHHAVGRDHAPYMGAEVGAVGLEVLHAVKARLDPAGIMNPGKLLPG